jgi:hypothetical protein
MKIWPSTTHRLLAIITSLHAPAFLLRFWDRFIKYRSCFAPTGRCSHLGYLYKSTCFIGPTNEIRSNSIGVRVSDTDSVILSISPCYFERPSIPLRCFRRDEITVRDWWTWFISSLSDIRLCWVCVWSCSVLTHSCLILTKESWLCWFDTPSVPRPEMSPKGL